MSKTWSSVLAVSEHAEANSVNRRSMEDAHCCVDKFCGVDSQALFAVFDGHGGVGIVKYLEKHFATTLEKNLAQPSKASSSCFGKTKTAAAAGETDILEAFTKTFLSLDTTTAAEGIRQSGSTVAAVIVKENVLYCANVGDTRIVLGEALAANEAFKAERLSEDHTAKEDSEKDRIEKAGGFILRGRVLGILSVSRAIGDHNMKQYIISRPYLRTLELAAEATRKERFLIIACDGVWDVFTDQAAVDYVSECLKKETKKEDVASKLVHEAIERGSQDNITAIVVFL